MNMFAPLLTYLVSDIKMDTKLNPVDTTEPAFMKLRTNGKTVPEIA